MEKFIFGVVDTTRGRAAYERLKEITAKINLVFDEKIILNEDHFLSEQTVDNNTNNYEFETWDKVMQTTIKTKPLQRGVKDNDVFIGIGQRITIDHRVIGQSDVIPQTYPNPFVFITGTNTGNAKHLYTIFNGEWSLEVGRTTYIPNETTRRNLIIPRTQQSLSTNQAEFNGGMYIELDPYPVMSGKSDNTLELNLKQFTGWAGASTVEGEENVITFEMVGITAQNAAGYVEYYTGEKNIDEAVAKWMSKNVAGKK